VAAGGYGIMTVHVTAAWYTRPVSATTPLRSLPSARRFAAVSQPDGQHFVFENASWGLYERLLREVGDGPTRLTYDNGRLEIMSPLPEHEERSRVICTFVLDLAMSAGFTVRMLGSSTLRRKLRRRGLEPDECFYLANEPRVRGKRRLSIPRDPPPDLAVEIDVTHSSIDRMPIYASLGVPEVWRYADRRLRCLHLRDGEYVAARKSLSFPDLRPSELTPFVNQAERRGQTAAIIAFRQWLAARGAAR
jgi:Uma2 family endonuclease